MRNLESLAELKKQGKMRIEERRDNFVRQSLLSDEFLDLIQRNKKPFDLLMCYYGSGNEIQGSESGTFTGV